ncbi:MAG: DegV family protein [Anaerolineales bacterium]|jgi:DegV family protein with EDD domain
MTIRIVTDSTCDLPDELIQKYGITVVPLFINVGEQGYLDGVELTREQFYERLPDWDPPPTTATPSPETFIDVYNRLAQEGASAILSIHISISLSATVDVARVAAERTSSVPVTVLDSRQLSLGTGFLVERAAQAAAAGKSMEEILEILDDQIGRTHVFAALETLEFLRRSGRMNGAIAGIGSLLQIKPLLKMYEGEPTSERVRTSNGASKRLLELLEEKKPFERLALVHTHADEKARALLDQVKAKLPEGKIASVDITPVIGAHIGPGAVGFTVISAKESA